MGRTPTKIEVFGSCEQGKLKWKVYTEMLKMCTSLSGFWDKIEVGIGGTYRKLRKVK